MSTIRDLASLSAVFFICSTGFGAAAERGPLRAGAARIDITPPVNPDYRPSGKYAHEHLFVRAIVLDNGLTRAALLNADLGGMPEEIWANASRNISEELKCSVENIIMSATHTHSGVPAGPPASGTATRAALSPTGIRNDGCRTASESKTSTGIGRVWNGFFLSEREP